jgi:hypothetical protein
MAALRRAQAEVQSRLVSLRGALPTRTAKSAGKSSGSTDGRAVDSTASQPTTAMEKVALFQSVFRGRTDVFPKRWENHKSGNAGYSPACSNDWVRGICGKPHVKCSECPNQAFIPLGEQMVLDHLRGKFTAGVYPLLPDDTCWFLAVDFDEESWKEDVAAFVKTCGKLGLPAAIERSRSGNGAHVWLFFTGCAYAGLPYAHGNHALTTGTEPAVLRPVVSDSRHAPKRWIRQPHRTAVSIRASKDGQQSLSQRRSRAPPMGGAVAVPGKPQEDHGGRRQGTRSRGAPDWPGHRSTGPSHRSRRNRTRALGSRAFAAQKAGPTSLRDPRID